MKKKVKYHENFGDGADTQDVHGDSNVHRRACNQPQAISIQYAIWGRAHAAETNENQIKLSRVLGLPPELDQAIRQKDNSVTKLLPR